MVRGLRGDVVIGRSLSDRYRLEVVVGPCEPSEAEQKLEDLKALLDTHGFRHEALSIGWASEVLSEVLADEPHLVHPASGRRLPWHEHDWQEKPYHDGTTLRTCTAEGCPFSEVVPAGAAVSQEGPE